MRIAVGADEDLPVVEAIINHLREVGHEVTPLPTIGWPDIGRGVGEAVVSGNADYGIVCCWTGTGVSIAANKVPGIRAALCTDAYSAEGARKWNDANVLAIGMRLSSSAVAIEMVDAFLATKPDEDEREDIAKVH